MSFEHRKYHWLYFLAGLLLAIIIGTLMGCEKGKTPKGRDCIGMAGMSWQGEQCEVIEYPPPWEREPEPPIACCMALTPSCEACQDGVPEDVWIEDTCGPDAIDVEYAGWNAAEGEPLWLCQAIIIN
jgi:hypothetical protein